MEFLLDYGLFLAKIATVVIAIIAILVIAKSVGGKSSAIKGELEITNLSEHHKQTIEQLEHHLHDDAFIKARDKAEKKAEKEEKKPNYYRMERSSGSFQRSIPLPTEVEKDQVQASFKKGVLSIMLPKSERAVKELGYVISDFNVAISKASRAIENIG